MNTRWKIEMFGELSARQDDRVVTQFRTYKTGVLLAYLAYHADRAHSREALIALLWPDSDLEQGRPSLSVALSSLRHQLEPPGVPAGAVLIANRTTVQLSLAACETDTAAFCKALDAAERAENAAEKAQWISNAVRLYRGEFLPGYYDDWCLAERERLAQSYLHALRQWIKHLAKIRDYPRALEYAQLAVRADPLREETHRDLMRLYVVSGRPAAALQHFRELEQRLRAETGTAPSPSTRRLAREITERLAQWHEETELEENRPQISVPVSPPGPAAPVSLTVGTVTFLLTDIAGARTLRESAGGTYPIALAAHQDLLRREFARHGGQEVRATGEGFVVAFARATDALACAVAAQYACASHVWPEAITALPMRIALHTGEVGAAGQAARSGLDNANPAADHATRILVSAHGGQILCSAETAALLNRGMEAEMRLTDLGLYRLVGSEGAERLFEVRWPGQPQTAFPPPDLERATTNSLPLQCTRFFGRQTEMAHLMDLLSGVQADFTGAAQNSQACLVTLTGPGGTGKTRLALEAANRLQERFQGAVWFVPLAELVDADRILEAVVDALRLPRSSNIEPVEQIARALGGRPTLIVLDNFEQLVETGASVVGTLLGRVPTMTCLVTSRQTLNLTGEREFRVTPLPIPPGTGTPEQLSLYESVQLFLDRAQAVKPDFQVTHANAPAIAELCARLEGIPLAIELAASRAQVLTPGQMLVQLDHRFDFLVSRKRDVAVRHRTLRAAVDWSYQLLTPELRRFFAQLSIFRGGWSLAAAETVCMEPLALDHLAQLHECSLLQTEEEVRASCEIRFRMLESLREYSAEQLTPEERTELAVRHAAYYLALAQEAAPALRGPDQTRWLDRLTVEYDNLRVALQWNIDHAEVETGLSLGAALGRFWLIRGHLKEGLNWLSRLLTQSGAARSAGPRGDASMAAGSLAVALADYTTALAYYEESLRIMREIGDQTRTGRILQSMGLIAWHQGDYLAARALYDESLQILQQLGDRPEISNALSNLAGLVYRQGDYAEARSLLDESLAIRREIGDTWGIASALGNLGVVVRDQGDAKTAETFQKESLILWQQLGDQRSTAESLEMLSGTASAQAQFGRAVRLLAAADRLRETAQTPATPNARADHETRLAEARSAMGETAFAAAHAEGRAMAMEQALAYALKKD